MSYTLNQRWATLADLIAAYEDADGALKLDLGCGYVKPDGFVGLDNLIGEGAQIPDEERAPDVFLDLDYAALPFAADSCSEVRASHFLEHAQLDHIFDEVFRVLRPGGTFHFAVPYANSAQGMFPGHHIFLTETFFYENRRFQKLFTIVKEEYSPTEIWHSLPWVVRRLLPFEHARRVLFNVCDQMTMQAAPRKDG